MRNFPSKAVRFALVTALTMIVGCGDSDPEVSASKVYPATPRTEFGGDRPVTIQVPSTYDSNRAVPLLIILHGYGANGFFQEQYLKLAPLVESEGILIIAPDGTTNSTGQQFWNATPACCNFEERPVDDVAYLRGLIAEISQEYHVDPDRIYLFGHSNGAFMAQRMACEDAGEIAAIVSLAGSTFQDPAVCKPSEPVSILNIHGDNDQTISYDGATSGRFSFPSASETTKRWQGYDHCATDLVADPSPRNLETRIQGDETQVQRATGCARGSGVELWTIRGGSHMPAFSRDFVPAVWAWLKAHPKS